jgi:hypothetical protein
MENKQTAVDWLILNLKSHFEHDGDLLEAVQISYQQAKEMEKEQILDSYDVGFADGWDDVKYDDESAYLDSEDYYNKTYEGNK